MVCSCHKKAKLLREGYGNVLILAQNRLIPYCMKNTNGICTADITKQLTLTPSWSTAGRNPDVLWKAQYTRVVGLISQLTAWFLRNVLEGGSSLHFLLLSWDKIEILASLYQANKSFMHPAPFLLLGEYKLPSQKKHAV